MGGKIVLGIEPDPHLKGVIHYTKDGKRFDYMGVMTLGEYVSTMTSAGISVELKPISDVLK